MNAFFNRIFGKTSKLDSVPASNPSQSFHSSIQGGSESSGRAQLVHVVMRDLLRKSGIPPGWIVCNPQVINSRSRGPGIFVRLSVKHWDDRLMQYAFAFQKTLLTDLVQFEPKAANWLRGIAWQLEVATTCQHTVLPDKDFWLEAPPETPTWSAQSLNAAIKPPDPLSAPKNSTPEQDALQDLEQFFSVRDKEIAEHSANNLLPRGYETTQPSPLMRN